MESTWKNRIILFYRFWEVQITRWMEANGGKKDQRPKSDEQVTSYHQKCQWNKFADFLLLKNSKPLDVQLFWIGSVNSCVQIARAQKTIAEKMSLEKNESHAFRKVAGQSNNLVLTFVGKAIHNWNWEKHHAKKKQSHTSVDCVTTYCSSRKRNYFTLLMILKYLNIIFEIQLCSVAIIKDSSIEAKREIIHWW